MAKNLTDRRAMIKVASLTFGSYVVLGLLEAYALHPDRLTMARPPYLFLAAALASVVVVAILRRAYGEARRKVGWHEVAVFSSIGFVAYLMRVEITKLLRDLLLVAFSSVVASLLIVWVWRVIQDVRNPDST